MSPKSTIEEVNEISNLHVSHLAKSVTPMSDVTTYENTVSQASLIGKAVTIKGELGAKEDILIDGRVDGTIVLKNNRLEVGITGNVDANIYARAIVISGEVNGNVYASDQVMVTKTGKVYGNIYASDIHIEDGAMLNGIIDMEKQDISKQHSLTDDHMDLEVESKETSFGFLFKRSKELPHLDHDSHASHNAAEGSQVAMDNVGHGHSSFIEKSTIGKTVVVEGQLIAEEDVVILGDIDGVVYLKNNHLDVGSHAKVSANLFTNSITAHGEIKGDIFANEFIGIKRPGHVFGVLHAPRISIESGAVLMGSVEMQPQNVEEAFATFISCIEAGDIKSPVKNKKVQEQPLEQSISQKPAVLNKIKHVPWPE